MPKITWKVYRCDVCDHEHSISTNHYGVCYPNCPNCSWRSGYDSEGNYYRADIGKNRPHYFVRETETKGE